MTRPLTVHNAEIKTAAVEIRTLTISGKQITLAVFRQLREEPLIAEDGTLNGVPWGIVNYHPDKCGNDSEHMHVVWQRGSELLRASVCPQKFWPRFPVDPGSAFLSAHVRDVAHGVGSPHFGGQLPSREPSVSKIESVEVFFRPTANARLVIDACEELEEVAHEAAGDPNRSVNFTDEQGYSSWQLWSRAEPVLRKRLADAIDQIDREVGPREDATARLYANVVAAARAEAERRQRHVDQWKAIADLPQLFIAV